MEANGQITNMLDVLSPESTNYLSNVGTDFDAIFQSGGNPNVFADGAGGTLDKGMVDSIAAACLVKIESEIWSYLNSKIAGLLSIPNIPGEVAKKMADFILTPGEIIKNLLLDKDILNELNFVKLKLALFGIIKDLIEGLKNIIVEKIKKILKPVTDKIKSILQYAAQGIAWVNNQLCLLANMIIKAAKKEIDRAVEMAEKLKKSLIVPIIEGLAKAAADVINCALMRALRSQLMALDRAIKKAKMQAITMVKKVAMEILAKLGG